MGASTKFLSKNGQTPTLLLDSAFSSVDILSGRKNAWFYWSLAGLDEVYRYYFRIF